MPNQQPISPQYDLAPTQASLVTLGKRAIEQTGLLAQADWPQLSNAASMLRLYQAACDNISHGICVFDCDQNLLVSNRRYADIYKLSPELLREGTSLRKIVEHRYAVGACPDMPIEDFLEQRKAIHLSNIPQTTRIALRDGRTIIVRHQAMPGIGWVATHDDITERKNENVSLKTLIDGVPDYLWVKDRQGRFVIANHAIANDIRKYTDRDIIGLSDYDIHPIERAEAFFASEQSIIQTGLPMIDKEELIIDARGSAKWVMSTKIPLQNDKGEVFGFVGIARDITARKREADLRDGQAQVLEMIAMGAALDDVLAALARLIENQVKDVCVGVVLTDRDGTHLRLAAGPTLPDVFKSSFDSLELDADAGCCAAAVQMCGTVITLDISQDPQFTKHPEALAATGFQACWAVPVASVENGALGAFVIYCAQARGPDSDETRLLDMSTRIAGIAIERSHAEARIKFMAGHDALTGLPNRSILKDRLAHAIAFAQRHGHRVSTLFIDLDNFKTVNDSLGHQVGDELLKTVATRMASCLRTTDTVVRLGGDEFAIVLFSQPKDDGFIIQTLQRIRNAIAEPILLGGHNLFVTSSIGITNYPEDGSDVATLMTNAEAAMYRAKEIGRDNFQFYTPALNISAHEKFMLLEDLREAVLNCAFTLNYQPQVDLRTGKIFGVEALIRWHHPVRGHISPLKFIPLAEETGLIVALGEWVLLTACRQNKAWQDAGLPPMKMCVNVSARQFKEKSWISRVTSALSESGMEAEFLELELTESLIMQDVDQAIATMIELQALGIDLAIDDFGTGYSSLSSLKNFPVARLKIDRSFVTDIPGNEHDKAVVSAVISLGQILKMRVIAEGVETDAQVSFLRDHNCDEMQGYHFSKPVTADMISVMLAKGLNIKAG